jgi:hypothetical protein
MPKLRDHWEFIVLALIVVGFAWAEDRLIANQPKKKCCENISVVCDCEPGLCMCLKYGKTCTDSCYDEAQRTGRVK